jgi:hypothetical protein
LYSTNALGWKICIKSMFFLANFHQLVIFFNMTSKKTPFQIAKCGILERKFSKCYIRFQWELMGGVERCLNVVTFMFYFKPNLTKLSYIMDDGNSCKVINLKRKRHYYKTLGCKHPQRLFSLTIY